MSSPPQLEQDPREFEPDTTPPPQEPKKDKPEPRRRPNWVLPPADIKAA